ncbi:MULTISPECIES: DUF262 domain-containing protein [unclassified Acinetobacter]|uniref:DUF262 domain-containing protein n=1 Tax=unclassified Acinetobacter TaxID=196816 RepID=UPI0029350F7A|nr:MULTISPECIES: DUF262 domain-containing protein [unclassified Acinetobacter]WOE32138.1 DUF262 domain-containing protein [Acinetobacter sp. SAAs470]WOE37608.1 DUF262 domain-containing protein [Acinetobacter sp. SAAs474]
MNVKMTADQFYSHIKPIERPIRTFHCGFSYLETWIKNENKDTKYGIDLNPDFQRGHVWTQDQQVHYIENVLRRIVDESGLTIRFNNPTWRETKITGDLIEQVVCIDGLQRLTAIRKFIAGELNIFGISYSLLPARIILRDLTVVIKMYDFANKADLLSFYLDINAGGTYHTESEINRVRELLKEVKLKEIS